MDEKPVNERLFCLDILRGLDMFLLTALGSVLLTGGKVFGAGERWFYHMCHHPEWVGFSFWDMVMPLFIFMCGAAVPFAIGGRIERGEPVWRHVIARVALLWFFGMLVQGNLATFDTMKIKPYSNTLQSIAAGYLIATLVLLARRKWVTVAAAIATAGSYSLMLHFLGDYTPKGNFAHICEMKVLSWLCPQGSLAFNTHDYTWFLTSLMCGFMTLCGMLATDILRSSRAPRAKALQLFAYGGGLLVFGFAVQPWIPCIKHIFTLSFTAQAMGYSVISLAVLYVITDIFRFRKGTGILILYGQHALFAYMITHFFGKVPDQIAKCLTQGLPHLLGEANPWVKFLNSIVAMCVLTVLMMCYRRLKTKSA